MFAIEFTHSGADPEKGEPDTRIPFPSPAYFTGLMLERWPEYLRDVSRAYRFESAAAANVYRSQFKAMGFSTKLVSA